ncbi:hypothetical protein TMES_00955 [Thalassospira mesophila]|uniref:Uncharacterized protein n=1 Tax=Thalassospira mesophila TaxID=1293891 RepID=A0A1Y2L4E6_9PROT|nr:hypothetical protein TMES_00955 [Thalassospira mesophila]
MALLSCRRFFCRILKNSTIFFTNRIAHRLAIAAGISPCNPGKFSRIRILAKSRQNPIFWSNPALFQPFWSIL